MGMRIKYVVCVWCVFLVLALVHWGFSWWVWVRGCFLVENRGASSVEANTLSGSRSTPLSVWLACYRPLICLAFLVCGVFGGLVVCVVGCL